ncbi:hypothetical protein T484DRAFT_1869712 [Baffinella frigidus]|nr:hypothetical protein T484DRAFT_1869712 [Cryptophyta sp. CCMP2293]
MPKKRLESSSDEEPTWNAQYVMGSKTVKREQYVLVKWETYSVPTWEPKDTFQKDVGGKESLAKMMEAGKDMSWQTGLEECEESDSDTDTEDEAPKKRKRIHRVKSEDESNEEPEPRPSQKKKKKRRRDE